MDAGAATQRIYHGEAGYVTVDMVESGGRTGAVFCYVNPDPRKLHAVDSTGMKEMYAGVEAIEARVANLEFAVFHGAYDPVHAGADITEFAGEPDYAGIQAHLDLGTSLDTRIKALWPKLRTVGVFCGDRYGGSVEWPLFAEWGICDTATSVQFTEVHLGIVPGWNGVLNTMLKAGALNAQYMASTGNPVTADRMQQMGLVQSVVEVPAAPNRREVPKEEWGGVWAEHAAVCQASLLEAALALAVGPDAPTRNKGFTLADKAELTLELKQRMNPAPYRELHDRIAAQASDLDPETAKDELKTLGRSAMKDLAKLGKPLAPAAVSAVEMYVEELSTLSREEIIARFDELGHFEASQCGDLMHTAHRRVGVGAVLARGPAEKVPVFD